MSKLRICIIDLIHNGPSNALYRRLMFPNYTSVMPQIIGVWCREEGHEVHYSIFTGSQKLEHLAPDNTDLVFISAFTYTAQLAYALSSFFRSQGIVTVLGGPHARCYPEDACQYFDYVLGITDRALLKDLLLNFEGGHHMGTYLSSDAHPTAIPSLQERWEFIQKVHQQMYMLKIVPVIGSFGCPYHCDFCIDSETPYQVLDLDQTKADLQFLMKKMKHPRVAWYDPNFGIKFSAFMDAIESVVPPGKIDFFAECSLSLLTESNAKRLKRNGFVMIMPGIESWFGYGNKSRTGTRVGMDKVKQVADQVNMIQRYIPQVQTNFLFGMDSDTGPEPFTLTKRFIDLAPGAYPSFALLSVYGQAAKGNIRYENEDRIIPFPFHMMRSVHTLNVVPRNYSWEGFYKHFIDLLKYSFSARAMHRRFKANNMAGPRWVTLLLSLTIGGYGKRRFLSKMLSDFEAEPEFQSFVKKETNKVPAFMIENIKKELGPMWQWLPDKSLSYNTNVLSKPELVTKCDPVSNQYS